MRSMTNKEELTEAIIKKMDYVLGGITDKSPRDRDLLIAQTVMALSEAYKNLQEAENDSN